MLYLQVGSSPVQKPDGRQTVTMIPGDGVGPELMTTVQDVFKVAGVPVDFEEKFLRYISYGCYVPCKVDLMRNFHVMVALNYERNRL